MAVFMQAFQLQQKFLHESGDYGELSTGDTTLAFAAHSFSESNFPQGHVRASDSQQAGTGSRLEALICLAWLIRAGRGIRH